MPLKVLAVAFHTLVGDVIWRLVGDVSNGPKLYFILQYSFFSWQSNFNMNLVTRCEKIIDLRKRKPNWKN